MTVPSIAHRTARALRPLALVVLMAAAMAACSQTGADHTASTSTTSAASSPSPSSVPAGGGLNDSVNVQAMLSSWASGQCPDSGAGWGGFDHGLTLASSSAAQDSTLTLAPAGVDRVLLCSFSGATSKLDGSALVTSSTPVSQLASALNSVKAASNATCTGTSRVMILLGQNEKVAGLDMAVGGCPYIGGAGQFGAYNTSLLQIVDTDLGKK